MTQWPRSERSWVRLGQAEDGCNFKWPKADGIYGRHSLSWTIRGKGRLLRPSEVHDPHRAAVTDGPLPRFTIAFLLGNADEMWFNPLIHQPTRRFSG